MTRPMAFFAFAALSALAAVTLLQGVVHAADTSVLLAEASAGPGVVIGKYLGLAFTLGGLIAFGAIVWGGFKYIFAAGNPSSQSDARDQIWQAVIGLLLLIGAGLILRTIDPALVNISIGGTGVTLQAPKPPTGTLVASSTCSNLPAIAVENNVPSSPKAAPNTLVVEQCIINQVRGKITNLGEISTFDRCHDTCNYTRGNPMCDPPPYPKPCDPRQSAPKCSHTLRSCHYGGQAGDQGALAIDFGLQPGDAPVTPAEEQAIREAAAICDQGSYVLNETNHMHVSLSMCDAD